MSKKSDRYDEVCALRHSAMRNAQYHIARRRWLDGLSRWSSLAIVLSGTAAAAKLADTSVNFSVWLGGFIALLGALQLVFDWSGRARTHEMLQRRYFEMLATIEAETKPTEEDCANWHSQVSLAAADEPPTMRALDAIIDNQATNTIFGGTVQRIHVSWWQSATRHVFAHNGGKFPINSNWKPA